MAETKREAGDCRIVFVTDEPTDRVFHVDLEYIGRRRPGGSYFDKKRVNGYGSCGAKPSDGYWKYARLSLPPAEYLCTHCVEARHKAVRIARDEVTAAMLGLWTEKDLLAVLGIDLEPSNHNFCPVDDPCTHRAYLLRLLEAVRPFYAMIQPWLTDKRIGEIELENKVETRLAWKKYDTLAPEPHPSGMDMIMLCSIAKSAMEQMGIYTPEALSQALDALKKED